MVGSSQEEAVALAAGRVGILAAMVVLAIALAAMPSVLALSFLTTGSLAGPEPHADWLGQILQSLNVLRIGAGAGLLLTLPLLRGERCAWAQESSSGPTASSSASGAAAWPPSTRPTQPPSAATRRS